MPGQGLRSQPAQLLEQLHRRWTVRQRRCGWIERHHVRCRRRRQFQVVTSGGQAEFGRALGGYINVVTKSGTNALRGTCTTTFETTALNATNALSGTKLPMRQQQFGGSLGGPVVRDRTFFSRTSNSACSIRPACRRSRRPRRAGDQRTGSPRSATRLAHLDRHLSEPRGDQPSRQGRPPGRADGSARRPLQLLPVTPDNSRGAGALRPVASAGLDNLDHPSRSATPGHCHREPSTKRARSSSTAI